MPTREHSVPWNYPLIDASEDKTLARPGVTAPFMSELVGVDYQTNGGLRPSRGFRRVHELDYFGGGHPDSPNTLHDETSEVIDFFPVDFRIGSEEYAYGFVYRALRSNPADGLADIFIDFWNSGEDTTAFGTTGELIVAGVDPEAQMDVQVWGRHVYVFVSGQSPSVLYVDETTEVTLIATEDAMLDSANPTANYSLGDQLTLFESAAREKRALLRFDVSDYDALTPTSALLEYVVQETSTDNYLVRYSRVTEAWVNAEVTWNQWSTGNNWATAGGDYSGAVDDTLPAAQVGRVTSPEIVSLVTADWASGSISLGIRSQSAGNPEKVRELSSVEGVNLEVRPRLRVTFDSPIYSIRKVSQPGPGLQPSLLSPERAGAPGSLSGIDEEERPGAGQILLTRLDPESLGLFPDADTGLCSPTTDPFAGADAGTYPIIERTYLRTAENVASLTVGGVEVEAGDILLVFVATRSNSDTVVSRNILDVTWNTTESLTVGKESDYPAINLINPGVANFTRDIYSRHSVFFHASPSAGVDEVVVNWKASTAEVAVCVLVISGADPVNPIQDFPGDNPATTSWPYPILSYNVSARGGQGPLVPCLDVRMISASSWTNRLDIAFGGMSLNRRWEFDGLDPIREDPYVMGYKNVTLGSSSSWGVKTTPLTDINSLWQRWPGFIMTSVCVQSAQVASSSSSSSASSSGPEPPCVAAMEEDMDDFNILLVSPSHEQVNVGVETELRWTGYYGDRRPLPADLSYELWFAEVGTDLVHVATLPPDAPSFDPGDLFINSRLSYGTTYRWKVVAKRGGCPFYEGKDSDIANFRTESRFEAREFEPGDYTFAYQLHDSKTGRRSAFSEVAQVREEEFDTSLNDTAQFVEQFIALEVVYDSNKYDQLFLYRSVKIQDAGGTDRSGYMNLESIVDLVDYHTCRNFAGDVFDPDTTDLRHAIIYYALEDKQLIFGAGYGDRSVFDAEMPYGGDAIFYENTMLVSKIKNQPRSTEEENRPEDNVRSLGEFRWSSAIEISPELFPPFNRYVPSVPTSEVIRFIELSGTVFGFAEDRMYRVRKSGIYLAPPHPMHEGYGLVNHKAVTNLSALAFFVTEGGLFTVDPSGQLDSVKVFNYLITDEWRGTLDSISLAYDPLASALFMFNRTHRKAGVLWLNTSKASELEDMPFHEVRQGVWPSNWTTADDYVNRLQTRAFFIQNSPDLNNPVDGWKPRIFVYDSERLKTYDDGSATEDEHKLRVTTLDIVGQSRFRVDSIQVGGGFTEVELESLLGTGFEGAELYVVGHSTRPTAVGLHATIRTNNGSDTLVLLTDTDEWDLLAEEMNVGAIVRVGISPVPFRVIGHNVGIVTEEGVSFGGQDFLRGKQLSSVGAAFTDVRGYPTQDDEGDNAFLGLAYSGSDSTPKDTAPAVNDDGAPAGNIVDGEGLIWTAFGDDAEDGKYGVTANSLSPGLRIVCPDLDFRLLGMQAKGKILGTERTQTTRSA